MPMVLYGVVKTMAFTFFQNSGCMEKLVILILKSLSKKTDSDVDDKLVALLEEALKKKS